MFGIADHAVARPSQRCDSCPFKGKAIGTKGPEDSPFVIVGESPGARELAAGVPFVGPSGRMLEETLVEVGFGELGIKPFVVNALSCCPKDKTIPVMKKAASACQNRVVEQIKAHPRKVILTLGAAAAWAVNNDFSIKVTIDRGKIFESPLSEYGVVTAVHPAFLMRNGSGYPLWKKDLAMAVELFKGNKPEAWPTPTWTVLQTREQFEELVDTFAGKQLITGDVETDSLDAFSGRMLMLGITACGTHVSIIPEELLYQCWDLTTRLVENGAQWNWHNGKFDIRWFRRHGARAQVLHDTMLLSYAQNENRGLHDLDQVALRVLNAPNHKKVLDQYLPNRATSYRVIPSDVLHQYAAYDIAKTHQILEPQLAEVQQDKHLTKLYQDILIPASHLCAEIEAYGVKVSRTQIAKNEKELQEQLSIAEAAVQEYAIKHVGKLINLNSPKQVGDLLYNRLQLGAVGTSTDEDHLIKIRRKFGHPIVEHMLKYREIAKLKSTYVTNLVPLIHEDGRVRTSFKIHGTTTGRLAASTPNLLNQPRVAAIRSQYVADEGKIFVEVDLNQAELRSLALMSADPLLLDIYTKNEISIHDVTTAAFFGSKKELAENPDKLLQAQMQLFLPSDASPEMVYKEAKMRGKAVNFGIVYGREEFSLAEEFNIPVDEARRWIQEWFELYPGAKKFIDFCRSAPSQRRTLITNFGRKKRFGVVSQENLKGLENEAANFPHQSTASDIMLLTAIEVHQPLIDRWGGYIWNELYDAIYFEIDADDTKVAESIAYVQEVISRVPRDYGLTRVPFLGDAKVGYTWGTMKDWKGSIQESLG